MKTFAVGDVHGQVQLLDALLEQIRAEAVPGDTLVFVGDYVDRGPQSRAVVDRVLELRAGAWDGPVTALRGNHEEMMLDFLAGSPRFPPEVWLQNGGTETIASYTAGAWLDNWEAALPAEHRRFLEELPSWHQDEHAIYVHAGLPPGLPPEEAEDEDRLWIREPFIESDYAWEKVVVFGHTPQYEPTLAGLFRRSKLRWRPLDRPEKIGIDTGAAYGGPLTAVMLPERRFFSAGP